MPTCGILRCAPRPTRNQTRRNPRQRRPQKAAFPEAAPIEDDGPGPQDAVVTDFRVPPTKHPRREPTARPMRAPRSDGCARRDRGAAPHPGRPVHAGPARDASLRPRRGRRADREPGRASRGRVGTRTGRAPAASSEGEKIRAPAADRPASRRVHSETKERSPGLLRVERSHARKTKSRIAEDARPPRPGKLPERERGPLGAALAGRRPLLAGDAFHVPSIHAAALPAHRWTRRASSVGFVGVVAAGRASDGFALGRGGGHATVVLKRFSTSSVMSRLSSAYTSPDWNLLKMSRKPFSLPTC